MTPAVVSCAMNCPNCMNIKLLVGLGRSLSSNIEVLITRGLVNGRPMVEDLIAHIPAEILISQIAPNNKAKVNHHFSAAVFHFFTDIEIACGDGQAGEYTSSMEL